jgi:hypothetical protein
MICRISIDLVSATRMGTVPSRRAARNSLVAVRADVPLSPAYQISHSQE